VTLRVHSAILHEIVRVIDAHGRVPERVQIRGREYQVAYLSDHKERLEEAIRRRDADRVNMLYGQLASKVKYQLLASAGTNTSQAKSLSDDRRRAARTVTVGKGASEKKPRKMSRKGPSAKGARVWLAARARG
jgi:hypothetical protein